MSSNCRDYSDGVHRIAAAFKDGVDPFWFELEIRGCK